MRARQWQARNTAEGLEQVKPIAEELAQLNPIIAGGVAVTGQQATGGAATTTQRASAAVAVAGGLVQGVGALVRGAQRAWRWAFGAKVIDQAAHNGRALREAQGRAGGARARASDSGRAWHGGRYDPPSRELGRGPRRREGRVFPITGGDGVRRTLIQVEHEMNGAKGVYEWILSPAGEVTHQRFKAGAVVDRLVN